MPANYFPEGPEKKICFYFFTTDDMLQKKRGSYYACTFCCLPFYLIHLLVHLGGEGVAKVIKSIYSKILVTWKKRLLNPFCMAVIHVLLTSPGEMNRDCRKKSALSALQFVHSLACLTDQIDLPECQTDLCFCQAFTGSMMPQNKL